MIIFVGRATRSRVLALAVTMAVAGCSDRAPSPPVGPSPSIRASGFAAVPSGPTLSSAPEPSSPGAIGSGPPVVLAELHGTIAFAYDDGIWTADADGTHRRRLTRDGGFDPTLSPDGRRIVYRLLLEHDDGEIWVMNADGAHRRDLVDDPAFSDWGPAFSPDGRRIAFDSNRVGGLALWTMGADGTDQRILTHGHGEYPSWSPDGKRLAYAGGPYYDIRIVGADGSDDHAVATTAAYDMGPAWSPDGSWIAYHTQVDWFPAVDEPGQGDQMEIHLVRPDGTADHRITDDQVEDSFAAWSPDGAHLMWSRHGQLVVARPDGSGRIDIGPGNFPSWIP